MLGFNRWHLAKLLAAILCIASIVWFAVAYFIPAPPTTVTIATAFKGSTFVFYGEKYREIFARSHVKLEFRETNGAVDNLRLLQDPKSGVDIGFVNGGVSNGNPPPGLLSIGLMYNNAFWIFYRSTETLDRFSQLKGRRIAVGPEGSGTRFSAEQVLGAGGITSATATFLPYGGTAAVDALKDGKVDVAWVLGGTDAAVVKALLHTPDVRLMNIPMAEAFTRIFPGIVRLVLPQGVFDIEGNIPPNDVTLLATTNRLLIRDDLHPEIVQLLLRTVSEVHGKQDIFQRAGEFPTQTDPEYPMAASAVDYYKNGPSFLQRHLPLWLSVHVQRAIAVLVTAIAIGIPLLNLAPKLYRWFLHNHLRKLYRRLRTIEEASQTELTAPQLVTLQAELEKIDRAARILPKRHSDLFFDFNRHIDSTRARLVSRLIEVRSQTLKLV
jgi:TRAP transporter TAXI family solute receptor